MLGRGLLLAAGAVPAAWLLGRILSDRFAWSQFLLWIPTPAAAVAALAGLAVGARLADPASRRRGLLTWSAVLVVLAAHFGLVEHRLLRPARQERGALRLVHANVQVAGKRKLIRLGQVIEELDGAVTVVSCPMPAQPVQFLRQQLESLGVRVTVWPFMLATRLPVLEARPLVANDQVNVAVFRVDATAELGRPVTIYAVDLPSTPAAGRGALARRVRRILDGTVGEPPDLVVGDFNMTRGSYGLRTVFPGLEHAYDQAGPPYGATFPRSWPLLHIDHVLVGEALRATAYRLPDPGIGRHRFQCVELDRRGPPGSGPDPGGEP